VLLTLPYSMPKKFKVVVLFIIIVASLLPKVYAQDKKKLSGSRESQRRAMRSRDSLVQAINKSDTSINNLLQKLEQYTTTFNQVNNNLSSGLDTAEISQQLPGILKRLARIKTLTNTHKSSTLRYLFVLRDNLDHIQAILETWQSDLDDFATKLVQNQSELMRFSKDTLLKTVPSDSTLKKTFFTHRKLVIGLWHKTDSANRSGLSKVNILEDKVATNYTNVLDETDQIDTKIRRFAARSLTGEFDYIWFTSPQYKDFESAFNGTVTLNNMQLYYFVKNETTAHFAALLFLALFFSWIFVNRAKAKRNNEHPETILNQADYVYKQPFIASLLVVTAIVPYFYDHPPVIFSEALFVLSLVCVLILVKKSLSATIFNFLRQLFWLTLFYSVSNLLIEVTNVDRFAVFAFCIIAIIISYTYLKKTKNIPPGDSLPHTRFVLSVFVGMQLLSLFCNITGRFSLSKIIGITAVFNLWMLVILFLVVQIITQGLFLQFQTKKEENSFISWIDYNLLQKKFRSLLSRLATLLWLFFLLQNLNIDDFVTDYVTDILNQPRTVANASFTIGGFVIFIGVIWLSSVTSRIISYFYDISARRSIDLSALKKKNRTSTLLIRMAVFSIGFLLAVTASNFPLEKLTIIISAFGIGIGFGLQNIVNNLVSGLILAFEKPIQIGDIIEVDSRSGTIKEIGIRSSKLVTGDGAEVIIPNADLISHHVINWTLSNNNRRIELIIGVAYGTDIEKAKTLLRSVLDNRNDIMKEPASVVFLHNLNQSSVDFRLLFWADDINTWLQLKSNVLADIYVAFDKQGIEIPFPQQDVHVYLPKGQALNRNINDKDEPAPPKNKLASLKADQVPPKAESAPPEPSK
jgi:potassium efflux system protein